MDPTPAELQRITDAAPALIAYCDRERRYRFVNAPYAARFGLTPEQVVGKHIREVVGEAAYATLRPYVDEVLAGRSVEFEAAVPYDRLGVHHMRCAYQPDIGPDGATEGLIAVITDVTDRKRAEEALRASEERFRSLAETASDGIVTIDAESTILFANAALGKIFGYTADELLGQNLTLLMPEYLRHLHRASLGRYLETGHRHLRWDAIELPGLHHAGHEIPLEISFAESTVAGRHTFTGIVRDVTERKRVEEALRRADRMETVGRLAGGVAHEANNQMLVVLGAAEFILRRPDLPEPVRLDLEQIRAAAERTATISSQLLAFSRRQVLQPRVLDLNETVRGLESILRRTLGEANTLLLQLTPGLGPIKADPGQLAQVLLNLALNARDAMPEGGTLTIETAPVELTERYAISKPGVAIRPGTYALLAVHDTGQGMDQATLDRVFEPFFTTKPVGVGTGLGLSTVYGIVKQTGGYVWAYSEVGRGTTLKIYLPLVAVAEPAAVASQRPAPLPTGTETILLAEDEPAVRATMARALREQGYTVLEAGTGQEALALFGMARDRIDLAIVDVVMPGMDGRMLAAKLAEQRPDLPVLFSSGYTGDEVVRRGLLQQGQPFIPKPFAPEVLARTVRDLLDSARP